MKDFLMQDVLPGIIGSKNSELQHGSHLLQCFPNAGSEGYLYQEAVQTYM